MYLYIWTSLSITSIFSWRSCQRYARTPHTHLPRSTVFSHGEIMTAWSSLERYGSNFTRTETVYLLRARRKYHKTDLRTRQSHLEFARWLVEHGRLNETEVV